MNMSLTDNYGTFIHKDGINYMDENIIEGLHNSSIEIHGGIEGKNIDSLGSICHDAFYHNDKSVEGLAAHYLSRIVKGHPFSDGNKRTGFLTTIAFLGANSYRLRVADEELIDKEINSIAETVNMNKAYEQAKTLIGELYEKL